MWRKDKEFIDGATGAHVQVLHNPETGAEHIVQIMLGHTACPHCGTAYDRPLELGEINPASLTSATLETLNGAHAGMKAYAAKHRVPVRSAK